MQASRIIVVGGTGYTGSLVARELIGSGASFVLTGRDAEKLERLAGSLRGEEGARAAGAPRPADGPPAAGAVAASRFSTGVVDVTRPETLRGLLHPGDVVVSCAGPFLKLGEPVIRACVEAGAHYLDTTGEQRFMKRVVDRYDAPAREAGVTIVNAMGFEYALGDAVATMAAEGLARPLQVIELVYGWQGGAAATSRGTRASILRILASPGFAYRDGKWEPERAARRRVVLELPDGTHRPAITLPTGEIVILPRHLEVRDVRGWAVTGDLMTRAAALLSPVLPSLVRWLLPLLDRWARSGAVGPTKAERETGEFEILARATGANGATRSVRVRGRDPYGLTATIIVAAARRLATSVASGDAGGAGDAGGTGEAREAPHRSTAAVPAGVVPPVRLLPPSGLQRLLESRGVRWDTL